jgi:hypothetical protein
VLTSELLDQSLELMLSGSDLLREQLGTVLQVTTDVTH